MVARPMVEMNEDPVAYWRDEAGPNWVRAQPAVDRMLSPITERLLEIADAGEGERVVDVGCGCGTTTIAFGERVGPTGSALGLDVSDAMVDFARSRSTKIRHVEFVCADATDHHLEPTADLLTSRFGVMFFSRPVTAFRNLRTALRPSGRLAFACWQAIERNPWIDFLMGAFPEVDSPMPPPEGGPGPFSLSAPEQIMELLESAGFVEVAIGSFATKVSLGATPDEALHGMTEIGPLARILSEGGAEGRAEILTRARSFLEAAYASGPPRLDAAAWMVQARPRGRP